MRIIYLSAAALVLAACGNGGSAVETRDRAGETETAAAGAAAEATAAEGSPTEAAAGVEAQRGRPVWSQTRRYSSEENARRAFERNGASFGAADLDAYVRQAHAFVSNPPRGTETARRRNGDTLYYHAASNTFAVGTADGTSRTMFKPDDGAAYWAEQLERLNRGGGDGG